MAVTVKDVALLAGTSKAAVSAALSQNSRGTVRVSQATRDRIVAAAEELGYSPNPLAQSLSTGKTGVLGLVFPYADAFIDRNPFCSQIMNGVFSEAIRGRFNTMLYTGDGAQSVGNRVDPRVDGLIIVIPTLDSPLLEACSRTNFPCVTVVAKQAYPNIPSINADDFAGGVMATEHLIKLGHRRIAILQGTDEVSTNCPRTDGYRAAHVNAGLPIDRDLIVQSGFDWRPGFASMTRILEGPKEKIPTAVFCINDLCAEGAMRAIRAKGLRVPEDIAVVGFDDTWFAHMTQPPLTSVRMPIKEMGSLAVQHLVKQLAGESPDPLHPVLPVSLTVRQSCGAPPELRTQEDHDLIPPFS